jgi:hypothetical protein
MRYSRKLHSVVTERECVYCAVSTDSQNEIQVRVSLKMMSFYSHAYEYLGETLTHQNNIHEEKKSRLTSGSACFYSVQNLLSSHLLHKNKNTKIYIFEILSVVFYWCET